MPARGGRADVRGREEGCGREGRGMWEGGCRGMWREREER